MYPGLLYGKSEVQSLFTLRGKSDKFQDLDGQVFQSTVVRLRKMHAHSISLFFVSDVEKMALESLDDGVFGLAYILFFAGLACDAVDKVGAFTSNIVFARENFTCGCAGDGGRLV